MSARIEQIVEIIEEVKSSLNSGSSRIPIPFLRLRAVRSVAKNHMLTEQTVLAKITRELAPDINFIHEFDALLTSYVSTGSDKLAKLLLKHAVDERDKQLIHNAFASTLKSENTNASLAIVFADVCQSTQLFETYGDVYARKTISQALSLLEERISDHDGMLIKTIGDEVMCTFSSAQNAVFAASEMHRSLQENMPEGEVKIAIKVDYTHHHI